MFKCNVLPVLPNSAYSASNDFPNISGIIGYPRSVVMSLPISHYGTTQETIESGLSTAPIIFVYRLQNPQEINLTPEEIELLSGANVLWTDGDNIEITYKKLLLPSDAESLSKNKKIKEKPKTKRSKKKKEE
jgi:hypothetical protein